MKWKLTQPHFGGSPYVSRPSHAPIFLHGKSPGFQRERGDFFGGRNDRVSPVGIDGGRGDLLLRDDEAAPRYFVQRTRGGDLNQMTKDEQPAFSAMLNCSLPLTTLSNHHTQECPHDKNDASERRANLITGESAARHSSMTTKCTTEASRCKLMIGLYVFPFSFTLPVLRRKKNK